MSAENSENFRSNRFFGAHKRDLGALKDNNSRHFFPSIQKNKWRNDLCQKKVRTFTKGKDGRWEGRYIRCYDENGKAKYGYIYSKTYNETKQKLILKKERYRQAV